MKDKMFMRMANGFMAMLVLSVTGCTHPLTVTNLSSYYNNGHVPLPKRARIGVRSDSYSMDGRRLVKMTTESLAKYNANVTTLGSGMNGDVDVIATMSVRSDYKGSGWNFLINFPGFIVFAPAWHGYNYEVSHMIDVALQDAKTGKSLGHVNLPVVLDIRHADMNRTWTEISWLEVGAIALVGGVVFIQYDEMITPEVTQKAGPVIADYVAQEVINNIRDFKPAPRSDAAAVVAKPTSDVAKKLRSLKELWEAKLLTDEEYAAKRSKLVDAM